MQKGSFEHEGDIKGEVENHISDSTIRSKVSNPVSDDPLEKRPEDIVLKISRLNKKNIMLSSRLSTHTKSMMSVSNICKPWQKYHATVFKF